MFESNFKIEEKLPYDYAFLTQKLKLTRIKTNISISAIEMCFEFLNIKAFIQINLRQVFEFPEKEVESLFIFRNVFSFPGKQ